MLNKIIDKFELASKVELDGETDFEAIKRIVKVGNLKIIGKRAGISWSSVVYNLIEALQDMPTLSEDELDDLFA